MKGMIARDGEWKKQHPRLKKNPACGKSHECGKRHECAYGDLDYLEFHASFCRH